MLASAIVLGFKTFCCIGRIKKIAKTATSPIGDTVRPITTKPRVPMTVDRTSIRELLLPHHWLKGLRPNLLKAHMDPM